MQSNNLIITGEIALCQNEIFKEVFMRFTSHSRAGATGFMRIYRYIYSRAVTDYNMFYTQSRNGYAGPVRNMIGLLRVFACN